MKKLVIGLCIAVVAIIVVLIVFIRKPVVIPDSPIMHITLTDTTAGDADEMVFNFKADKMCKDQKTAFWLDAAWVDNVYSIIAKERGDGIRIYFAKGRDEKNTLVIVSTYRVGPDSNAESQYDHEDYFDHTETFFNSNDRLLIRDSPTDPGALLFQKPSPCPSGDCLSVLPNHISCSDAYKAVNNCSIQEAINTYSEWFSLKALKAIRDELASQTIVHPDQPGDGIRIYFAKHTKTTNPHHPGRHAFIIVTTCTVNTGGIVYHKDYFCPPPSFKNVHYDTSDNGEQCLNNCSGATLPAP